MKRRYFEFSGIPRNIENAVLCFYIPSCIAHFNARTFAIFLIWTLLNLSKGLGPRTCLVTRIHGVVLQRAKDDKDVQHELSYPSLEVRSRGHHSHISGLSDSVS